jgi:competence protein ComFC
MNIRAALKKAADTLFPYIPACVACGIEKGVDGYLCPDCRKEMGALRAGQFAAMGFQAVSAYEYCGLAASLVQRYKYSDDKWLCAFMASAMAKACDMTNADVICHVPLHDKRRKSRGFDQAEQLAKRLSELTGKPIVRAIKRVRHTPTQTKLSAAERQENVRGAFESLCPISGRIALVDDVLTTGATAAECAGVLLKSGAQSVVILTFARAAQE